MPIPATGPHGIDQGVAQSAGAIVELLDLMWENARQATTAAPASTSQLRLMYLVGRQPVTRMCDRLEALGFIRRHACPDSGRELTLRFTPAGENQLAQIGRRGEDNLSHALGSMTADGRRVR
ncbi:winged helix DNA-binding protein [Streptomyces sp. ISL-43]|uniref:MarR family winged helix-turn-helix transcriptional regulator n=1 Tax=Streptomyces sp. ISL-43 TaxID=2819183 RepID=UPI001BEBC613|nr:winged helix DNA-binding protein [Streptomyces sp. ISL-43]MBT2452513.1 winged helix DNA-binding protein [Streptomyces sp. ISL-43]